MKFCDRAIQDHLMHGGKIKRPYFGSPIYYNDSDIVFKYNDIEKVYCLDKEDLTSDDWEVVSDYYDELINNKVLCFFWNNNGDNYSIGYLTKIRNNSKFCYCAEVLGHGYTRINFFQYCKAVEGKKFHIMP